MNRVDPSGKAFVNMGTLSSAEGGDIGVGCNEEALLTRDCEVGGGGISGGSRFSLDRCAPDLAVFALTTVAGLVGVYIPEGDMAYAVPRALQLLDEFGPDVITLRGDLGTFSRTSGSNLGSVVVSVIQLLWDMGVELVKDIFQVLGKDIFAAIAAGLGLGSDLIPGVVEAKLALWGVGSLIGVAGLAADGCLPGQ